MMRTCTALLIVLTLFGSVAWAESWSGMVISTVETTVLASATGVLAELDLTIGEVVHEGDLIGYTDVSCVYATEDGTVSLVSSDEGDIVSGTVLEIAPVSRYRVVSTTSDAYSSPETCLVHGGETLYVRCTSDRSHLAIGFVTNVSGTSFDLFTTAGELYIGETVNLYRTPDYAYESKVGVGTVVETDLISYSAQGHLHTLRVQEGDRVERGQLLFTYASLQAHKSPFL